MDKIQKPYLAMCERLEALEQSISILNLVNNDLRQILQKQKPLPKFVHDSFKRPTPLRSKHNSGPSATQPPPTESEEIRLAASIIDKAKRTIENVGEKKNKQVSTTVATVPTQTSIQLNTGQTNRPKTSSSARPSSASSTILPPSDSNISQQRKQQQPIRRYVPAHMKAPFLTQAEKKRRPNSSTRTISQPSLNKKSTSTIRSSSQQQRQSLSSSTAQPITPIYQQIPSTLSISTIQNEKNSIVDHSTTTNVIYEDVTVPDHESDIINTEEHINNSNETTDVDILPVTQPIIINRALIKPLRRLWKQNQNLRSRLDVEIKKKSTSLSSPLFIERLNEKIHLPATTEDMRIPNIEVLIQLAIKIRSIILYLLEKSTFHDLDNALKRLNTLKYLVNQYNHFFTSNINILVAKYDNRSSSIVNTKVDEWLNESDYHSFHRNIVRYTNDSQLITFTEVRFKQFENECRWIELNWHEQMIIQMTQLLTNKILNPLQVYRELMCLVTGLQTSTPIIVENKYE